MTGTLIASVIRSSAAARPARAPAAARTLPLAVPQIRLAAGDAGAVQRVAGPQLVRPGRASRRPTGLAR